MGNFRSSKKEANKNCRNKSAITESKNSMHGEQKILKAEKKNHKVKNQRTVPTLKLGEARTENTGRGEGNRFSKPDFPDCLKHHLFYLMVENEHRLRSPSGLRMGADLLFTSYLTLWKLPKLPEPCFIYERALVISCRLELP